LATRIDRLTLPVYRSGVTASCRTHCLKTPLSQAHKWYEGRSPPLPKSSFPESASTAMDERMLTEAFLSRRCPRPFERTSLVKGTTFEYVYISGTSGSSGPGGKGRRRYRATNSSLKPSPIPSAPSTRSPGRGRRRIMIRSGFDWRRQNEQLKRIEVAG